jgi:hypothetical protein
MDSTVDVILSGEAAGDWFGRSVASAGDVNNDGYGDLIVGAENNDAGGTDAGRTYVYFGGATVNNTVDVTLTGTAAGEYFGGSVASAGDVNGDGYADIIVGAQESNAGSTAAGRAYMYYGGVNINKTADVVLTGTEEWERFGCSVAAAGDVNGDGFADVIVGGYGPTYGGLNTGGAYVYFGGARMDNIVDVTMAGAAVDDNFGDPVAAAGDINGDGYADLVIGAFDNDAGGTNAGRAYLYLSSSPPAVPRIASVKDIPNDQGGQVRARWIRSGYDAPRVAKIMEYVLQRSAPPGLTGFQW